MKKTIDIAVVGSAGVAGKVVVDIPDQRNDAFGQTCILGGDCTAGESASLGMRYVRVENLFDFDISRVKLASFDASAKVSTQCVPKVVEAGNPAPINGRRGR